MEVSSAHTAHRVPLVIALSFFLTSSNISVTRARPLAMLGSANVTMPSLTTSYLLSSVVRLMMSTPNMSLRHTPPFDMATHCKNNDFPTRLLSSSTSTAAQTAFLLPSMFGVGTRTILPGRRSVACLISTESTVSPPITPNKNSSTSESKGRATSTVTRKHEAPTNAREPSTHMPLPRDMSHELKGSDCRCSGVKGLLSSSPAPAK